MLDRRELGRIMAALGALLLAHPHPTDVEINPLRVTSHGLLALDAVITALTAPLPEDEHGHPDR